jgi:hypothetical protein
VAVCISLQQEHFTSCVAVQESRVLAVVFKEQYGRREAVRALAIKRQSTRQAREESVAEI